MFLIKGVKTLPHRGDNLYISLKKKRNSYILKTHLVLITFYFFILPKHFSACILNEGPVYFS